MSSTLYPTKDITMETVLVTGGTGFLGIHTIFQLLNQGYMVKTTTRSTAKKEELIAALNNAENISFHQADLLHDEGWDEAAKACDYVLHIASPFFAEEPKHEDDFIIPARDGSIRVLKAAKNAGVKRVVLTSSFAAIGYSKDGKDHIFTEADWTDPDAKIPAYIKSKTIAEKAAWEFAQEHELDLTVINPTGIFGPVFAGISSASLDSVIGSILTGAVKETPNFTFGVVDVRDVADIHIKAMLSPDAEGQRFLATSDGVISFYDVVQLIRKERPQLAGKIVDLQPIERQYYNRLSNQKAKDLLNWHPRSKEEAILASVDSLSL
jgi:nucleoside-diphosphate-sugar epimerase